MSDSTDDSGPRSIRLPGVPSGEVPALRLVSMVRHERRLAARDRASAQVDRRAAARDRRRAQAYARLAERDELTGVLLRGPGLLALRRAVETARSTRAALVLAFLDADHLKEVNDRDGHGAGDSLLRGIGAALVGALPPDAVIIRMGGDEFVCALSPASLEDASQDIADVRARLAAVVPGGSVSVGLASLAPADTWETLIARADRHMYEARRRLRSSPERGD